MDNVRKTFANWGAFVQYVGDLIDNEIVYMWNDDLEYLEGRLEEKGLPIDLFVPEDNGELIINRKKLLQTVEIADQLDAIHDALWDTTCTWWEVDSLTLI